MIPKVIHYCWFSNDPLPKEIEECIASWETILPDFKIKKWDALSFDFNSVNFVKQAFSQKKWAFVSDYIRLYALYTEGGIYLDSDVFVMKRFDNFLNNDFFSAIECFPGQNDDMQLQAAVIGSIKEHQFLKDCLSYYHHNNFINEDGSFNELISPVILAREAEKYGFEYTNKQQSLEGGMTIYPIEEIAPLTDYVTKNTKIVHCCAGSWRWMGTTTLGKLNYRIKDSIVQFLVFLGVKKTWSWKKKFNEFKSNKL